MFLVALNGRGGGKTQLFTFQAKGTYLQET